MPRRQQLTIRATAEQISLWEGVARWAVPKGGAGRFVAIAADRLAEHMLEVLREEERQKLPDPIAVRLAEKRVLGTLLQAAKRASPYIPDRVAAPVGGYLPIGKDLSAAIRAVEHFLQETGEEYPCP